MQKAKIKFHEPTIEEMQNQKMNHVFQMLKRQEDGMSALLKKYQHSQDEDLDEYFSHKSRQSHVLKGKDNQQPKRKSKSLNKSHSKSKILLPQIKLLGKQNQRVLILADRRKKKHSHTIQVGKTSLRRQLEVLYSDRKNFREKSLKAQKSLRRSKSIGKSRLTSQNSTIINGMLQKQKSARRNDKINFTSPNLNNSRAQRTSQTSQIPKPLQMSRNFLGSSKVVSQPSDSQQQDIPIAYYQRQFKSKMTGQCIQQINYLYFSKNESIKDWSETLLTMFQKHDKEIMTLRRKMKYLEKFDDKFFAADIYKNQ